MPSLLAAMHALAAQHGEGLRPQLVALLEGTERALEADRRETRGVVVTHEPDPRETVKRIPTKANAFAEHR